MGCCPRQVQALVTQSCHRNAVDMNYRHGGWIEVDTVSDLELVKKLTEKEFNGIYMIQEKM